MKLLIVGLNYAPEPVGIGPYTAGLAEAMARRGHRVEVIAGKPYYPQWRSYPGFARGWVRANEGGVVLIFEDVTARVRADRKILHMARYDALTGLRRVLSGYREEMLYPANWHAS